MGVYRVFLIVLGLIALIIALVEVVIFFLSFIDKRRFFLFPEYDALKFRDRMKKRMEAFFGSKIEYTIYEKENKLYQSLGVGKVTEAPVDLLIFVLLIIPTVFLENLFIPSILLIIMVLLLLRRRINRNNF